MYINHQKLVTFGKNTFLKIRTFKLQSIKKQGQAGAELGQAQLKLGLGFTSINLNFIDNQDMSPARSTATNHYITEHK